VQLREIAIGIGLAAALAPGVRADNLGPFSCNLQNNCASHTWNASAFNVVTLGGVSGDSNSGNYTDPADAGGGIAVAGNLIASGSPIGSQKGQIVNPYTSANTLVVDGQIQQTNRLTVGNNTQESVYYRSAAAGFQGFNATAPTINAVEDFDFLSAGTALKQLSTQTLANYAGALNTAPVDNGTNYALDLRAKAGGTYVYNVDASYFQNQNRAFEVDLNGGQTAIVNITNAPVNFTMSKGTVIQYAGSQVGQTTTGGVPVLFNVISPATLTIAVGGQLNGTLLAPTATFTGNNSVDGQLFVATLNASGEIHNQYFSGTLPSFATVPEPATGAVCLASVLLWGAGVRRGRFARRG
jgi:choice-of-anchor A domain-containing protein